MLGLVALVFLLWPVVVLLLWMALRGIRCCPLWLTQYTRNVWVCLDQGVNTFIGGDEDETLSSRAGKAARNGHPWPARVIDFLVWLLTRQQGHCASCIEEDEGGNAIT